MPINLPTPQQLHTGGLYAHWGLAQIIQKDNPQAGGLLNEVSSKKTLLDRLYTLIPPGQTQALDIKEIIEIKAQASFYVVKDVSRKPVFERDYNMARSFIADQLDTKSADTLGIIHFAPDNIVKRMNFRPAEPKDDEKTEPAGDV